MDEERTKAASDRERAGLEKNLRRLEDVVCDDLQLSLHWLLLYEHVNLNGFRSG